MLAISQFADLYADLFEEAEPFAAYQLLAGFSNKTVESGQQLWALSRQILASSAVQQCFGHNSANAILAALAQSAAGRHFLTAFNDYLATHGYRADKLSLHAPFWVEEPVPVIKNLQNYIQQLICSPLLKQLYR